VPWGELCGFSELTSGVRCGQHMNAKDPSKAELEAASDADELLQDRIVEAIGDAVQEAIRDHKRAGNPIAEWRDGRVVLVPPDQIED
jgi:hypothetical protein